MTWGWREGRSVTIHLPPSLLWVVRQRTELYRPEKRQEDRYTWKYREVCCFRWHWRHINLCDGIQIVMLGIDNEPRLDLENPIVIITTIIIIILIVNPLRNNTFSQCSLVISACCSSIPVHSRDTSDLNHALGLPEFRLPSLARHSLS